LGRDGWDLGAWLIIVVALFVDEERSGWPGTAEPGSPGR
jgi:hypothetical protein